jgi:hypothetical protein
MKCYGGVWLDIVFAIKLLLLVWMEAAKEGWGLTWVIGKCVALELLAHVIVSC